MNKENEMQFDKDFNTILPNIITLTQGDYREESQILRQFDGDGNL